MSDVAVGILMGSKSDMERMKAAEAALSELGIASEVKVISAHRSPELAAEYARTAASRGLKAIICGAGMAAHLAGAIAAHTTLPVIGVPIESGGLSGLDALLATVQMPPGIPVATVAVNGAKNAAILAAQIIAVSDPDVAARLVAMRQSMAAEYGS